MRFKQQIRSGKVKQRRPDEETASGKNAGKTFPAVDPVQKKNAGVVQLYRTNAAHSVSDGLELNSHSIRKDSEFSRTYQDTKLTYSSENGNFTGTQTDANDGTTRELEKEGLPPLKISETDQMAIVNDGAQQREFFATQQLFDTGNQQLGAAAAKVRLGKEGGNLQLVDNGPQLFRIVPLSQPVPQGNWVKLENLTTTYCNKVTDQLIGATARVAVLSKAGPQQDDEREETEVPMKLKHNDPSWLREYLSQPDNEKPDFDKLGTTYENYFREDPRRLEDAVTAHGDIENEKLDQEAQKYGLNEHALPEPGEAYMTTSIGSPEYRDISAKGINRSEYFGLLEELQALNPALDIAEQDMSEKAKTLIDSWSYHFATVVARDGEDTMTLENYNRGVENENNIRDIFHKLFIGFEEFREEVQSKVEGGQEEEGNIRYGTGQYHELIRWMAGELPQKKDDLSQNAKTALEEALDSVNKGLNVSTNYQNKLLYFEMYGSGAQSLHTKFKPTGYNPNTIRVRESFDLDKETQIAKTALFMPRLIRHFKNYNWNSDVAQKFIDTYLFGELSNYVEHQQELLANVADKTQLDQWRMNCSQYQFPEVLLVMTNIVNTLVPFNSPIHPLTIDLLVTAIERVNELNRANTFTTFESTLRNDFRDLGLSSYNMKDKKAIADLGQMPDFINVLLAVMQNLI